MKCQKCQQETFLPFKCPYCGEHFCSEHRLPENHECPQIAHTQELREETPTMHASKQKPLEYTLTYIPVETQKRKIQFSRNEIKHLTIAALLVASIGLSLGMFSDAYFNIEDSSMLTVFTAILTASFFAHEIAHKIAAQKRGLWAEFRLTLVGALLTLFSIVSPLFKIISPGAVMISGFTDRKSLGKISIAGPATNILLSTMFFLIALLSPQYANIFQLGAAFNAWIALFNLVPFGILDGFKIFTWDKKAWFLAFVLSLALTIISYRLII